MCVSLSPKTAQPSRHLPPWVLNWVEPYLLVDSLTYKLLWYWDYLPYLCIRSLLVFLDELLEASI